MEDSGILNPLNSKPQGRCLTFFTPKKWLRTSSKSLFILKFKSTVLLSQNSYKIPKSPRSYVGEHASARGSPWGGKHWRQRSSMEATCCHVWARASTKTRSSRVVGIAGSQYFCLPTNFLPSEGMTVGHSGVHVCIVYRWKFSQARRWHDHNIFIYR